MIHCTDEKYFDIYNFYNFLRDESFGLVLHDVRRYVTEGGTTLVPVYIHVHMHTALQYAPTYLYYVFSWYVT